MRALALLALAALIALSTEGRASDAGGWTTLTASAPRQIDTMLRIGSAIYLDHGSDSAAGRYERVYLDGGAVVLEAQPNFLIAPAEHRSDMLPDGLIVNGRGMVEAWLAGPTQRYRHGVLGDGFEATSLKVIDDLRRLLRFELPANSVFEDRYPRLADLDGDGRDEAVVVRSYLDRGSALAVFTLDGDALALAAESEPIGQPQRWLNPVGVGDFDGDGRPEIAVVETPHSDGHLVLYALADGKLVPKSRHGDFSNHAVGSRELGMSAIADFNGDGIVDIALPNATRRVLRLVSFAGGTFTELARIDHAQPIATAIHAVDLDRDGAPELVYALDNATVVVLKH
jgi:FG-GAP-like repeat